MESVDNDSERHARYAELLGNLDAITAEATDHFETGYELTFPDFLVDGIVEDPLSLSDEESDMVFAALYEQFGVDLTVPRTSDVLQHFHSDDMTAMVTRYKTTTDGIVLDKIEYEKELEGFPSTDYRIVHI